MTKKLNIIAVGLFAIGMGFLAGGYFVKNNALTVGYHHYKGVVYTVQVDSAGTQLVYDMAREAALRTVRVNLEDSAIMDMDKEIDTSKGSGK